MEPYPGGQAYQYLPLPPGIILSYRIFTLYSASDISAPIQGNLHIASAQYSEAGGPVFEKFEALSYAWGDDTPTGIIKFIDDSYLPIAANLEAFLRYRRQQDQPVTLWIDAICINQKDDEERSSQVPVMGQIYLLARSLRIWIGPPSEDSAVGMETLREISYETPFSKLSVDPEESARINCLLRRAWWYRAWIVQEVAFGGMGSKYESVVVRCGFEEIKWLMLVKACARMHMNAFDMRQIFPAVETVLSLDALLDRSEGEVRGTGESYASRLLKSISKNRYRLAKDPRDEIYALLGLWADIVCADRSDAWILKEASHHPAPTVNYQHSVEKVYTDFAIWILSSMQSLQMLHHCQSPCRNPSEEGAILPTWVPDWSQNLKPNPLPCTKATEDSESMLKELQCRPDVLFLFPDESDRALGVEEADERTAVERTQDHNEKVLQKQLLSECIRNGSLLRKQYSAAGSNECKLSIIGRELHVRGILCDTIQELHDVFPGNLDRDWTQSTLLMVLIGRCKQAITQRGIEMNPYLSEQATLVAFWKTLFAGQQANDETKMASWLPLLPQDWQWTAPALTVIESGRLEYAEIRAMIADFAKHLADMDVDGASYVCNGFDDNLAKNNILLDARWTQSDLLNNQRTFDELGKQWTTQPYDLYHRPFNLPYVVPDPFWESRRIHDKTALEASIEARHRTIIESLDGPTREFRRDLRRFMINKIRQQPAREPQGINDARLIKYALGRRFFVSKDGYFGLAPPNAQRGDQVAILYGADTPFILRKTGSTFQVIGESYLDGLMDGEAVEKWRLGTREDRNIVLI